MSENDVAAGTATEKVNSKKVPEVSKKDFKKVPEKAKTVKMLDEVQSLRVDLVNLQTQLLREQELNTNLQQAIVEMRKELAVYRTQLSRAENEKLIDDLGLKGEINLKKLENGRYQAEF